MSHKLDKYLKERRKPNQKEPWVEWEFSESTDINTYIEIVNELSDLPRLNIEKHRRLFRGQANSDWHLQPKIWRELKGIECEEALRLEFDSIRYFRERAHLFLDTKLIPHEGDPGGWLALMQHYRAPTRMLDWTTSPNVALYFAVMDYPIEKSDGTREYKPGAVWFYNINSLLYSMKRYPRVSIEEYKIILADEDSFVEFGLKKSKPNILMYTAGTQTERMLAQKSVLIFSDKPCSDYAEVIGNALLNSNSGCENICALNKITIPVDFKSKLKEYLHKLDISAHTLFPGLDGLGKAVSEILRTESGIFYKRMKAIDDR